MKQKTNKPHIYRKFCLDCEKLFSPTGKYQKYCDKCMKKRLDKRYNRI
jgi:hypothetical protein